MPLIVVNVNLIVESRVSCLLYMWLTADTLILLDGLKDISTPLYIKKNFDSNRMVCTYYFDIPPTYLCIKSNNIYTCTYTVQGVDIGGHNKSLL